MKGKTVALAKIDEIGKDTQKKLAPPREVVRGIGYWNSTDDHLGCGGGNAVWVGGGSVQKV